MAFVIEADETPRSLEGFVKKNTYFMVPWIILGALLFSMRYVPKIEAYFVAHSMEPLGFASAGKLAVWCILCSYAVHGWIAVNQDEIMSLKVVKLHTYDFKSGDASIRSTCIFAIGMMTYALVPMRMAPAETWGIAIFDFLKGYIILLIGGDAWFFACHKLAHCKPQLYRQLHKTHHKWAHPVSFSAYYICSGMHMLQEHAMTIPCLWFLPVPWSAFAFWQYYGVPVAQMQHCGFYLEELHVPFCESLNLKLGHLMSVCGLGLGYILGSQSTAEHDYHHETFVGNYQLSYTYLDRLFGSYVERKQPEKSGLEEGLLQVA